MNYESSELHKLKTLKSSTHSIKFLSEYPEIGEVIESLPIPSQTVIYSVLYIEMGPIIFQDIDTIKDFKANLDDFLELLQPVEEFYSSIGGIVGYHQTVIKLIQEHLKAKAGKVAKNDAITYYHPEGFDCTLHTSKNQQEIWALQKIALEHLDQLAEVYPVGGAGERLHLVDQETQEPLPAAQLKFCGRTLLEGLIRDIQAREFLYYKLFGKEIKIPIAAMTSKEKDNHTRVVRIFEDHNWFGRGKDNVRFFTQPLVPMLRLDGLWAMSAPMKPIMRPGGHGVIWHQAKENGIFDWFKAKGRDRLLIRQINNPIAGLDSLLLTITGSLEEPGRLFGFASCPRALKSAEGMNVLLEKRTPEGKYDYCITNIEYTNFETNGLTDVPAKPGSPYSAYPSNTNVLCAKIAAIETALHQSLVPGLLINTKSKVSCYQGLNSHIEKQACRLESTMQNIADYIVDRSDRKLKEGERSSLKTYIHFNERIKTLSTIKNGYEAGEKVAETPVSAFWDLMRNYAELLKDHCQFALPPYAYEKGVEHFLKEGSPFVVLFHPALGPVFDLIGQKIRGGRLERGSEWVMEIAEVYVRDLNLSGSLIVEAKQPLGEVDSEGQLHYDAASSGKCSLINVTIENYGAVSLPPSDLWKKEIERKETLHIVIEGNGEFHAENVTFKGNIFYHVPTGERWVLTQKDGKIDCRKEKIQCPSWCWKYKFDANSRIVAHI